MHAGRPLGRGRGIGRQLWLFRGELVFEGLPLALFALRHPELIGLTPTVGRINDDVAVVIADLIGIGRLARAQGVVVRHSGSIALELEQLNTRPRNLQKWRGFSMTGAFSRQLNTR